MESNYSFSSTIRPKDWSSLFSGRNWGTWTPPPKPKERAEEYYVEALLWWLNSEHDVDATVLRWPDREIRNSPQPDIECGIGDDRFWAEISALYNPNDRMERLGAYESFVKNVLKGLRGHLDGKWTLQLPGYKDIPLKGMRELANRLAEALVREAGIQERVVVSHPIEATLEERTTGPEGVIVGYTTTDSHRSQETPGILRGRLEMILKEADLKFVNYDLNQCCVLVVTTGNTLGADLLPDAFSQLDSALYSELGGIFWLTVALPHRVQTLHHLHGFLDL